MGKIWKRWKVPYVITIILITYMTVSLIPHLPNGVAPDPDYPIWVYANGCGSICITIIGIPLVFVIFICIDKKRTKKMQEEERKFGKHRCSKCGYPIFPPSNERPIMVRCQRCRNPELLEERTPIISIEEKGPITSPIKCKRCQYIWTTTFSIGTSVKCPRCGMGRSMENKPVKRLVIDLDPDNESERYAMEEEESYSKRVDYDTGNKNNVYVKVIICPECGHHSTITYTGQKSANCEECNLTLKFADRKAILFMKR